MFRIKEIQSNVRTVFGKLVEIDRLSIDLPTQLK